MELNKTRGISILTLTSSLLISAIHNGNIYASMPPQEIAIQEIILRRINYPHHGLTDTLEVKVNQNDHNIIYNIIGGISLGTPGYLLPHETWSEIDIALGKKGVPPTAINFLKVIESSKRRNFNHYPFVRLLRAILMDGPEWQNDVNWLRSYDYKRNGIGIVRKFCFFLNDLYQYLDFWEKLFQERGEDRFQETIDHYKESIKDAQETASGVILMGVELGKAASEDSYFFGIEEKLRGKLWKEEPIPFIPPFAAFFSPEMLLFYAVKNNVFLYDMQLPCALLERTLPEEMLFRSIFSSLNRWH